MRYVISTDMRVSGVQGGFIWLFYGSTLPKDERPPIPFVPELEDPSWKPVYGEIQFECNHWSVFENAIDMAHIHYLHNDTFGNQVGYGGKEFALLGSAFLAQNIEHIPRSDIPSNVLQGQPQIRGMTCSTDAYGVHADFRLHNKPVNAMWEFSKVRQRISPM